MASSRDEPPHENNAGKGSGDATSHRDLLDLVTKLAPDVSAKFHKEIIEHQKHRDRLAHEAERRQAELGYLGQFFGTSPSVYIAGILAVCLLGMMIGAFNLEWEKFQVVMPLLASAFTSIVGYLFGKGAKGNS